MLARIWQRTSSQQEALRAQFVGHLPPAPQTLNADEERAVAAYLVMCHGLAEYHLELCARWVANQGVASLKETGRFNRIAVSLARFHSGKVKLPHEVDSKDYITSSCIDGCMSFRNNVANNHGIRESNLIELFYPVGFDLSTQPTFVAEAEEFGRQRGSFAHRSHETARRSINFDPHVSYNRVVQFFGLLDDFTDSLNNYLVEQV